MPTFDIVSEVNFQEVDNAVNQAKKEIETRYDFKGSKSEIKYEKETSLTLIADDRMKLRSIVDVISQKMSKRGISPKSLDFQTVESASGDMLRQNVLFKNGIKSEDAKKITKTIKEFGLKKIQAQIQGEQIRITGPKRDDLQAVISLVKEHITDLDLQFINFRD